MPLDLDALLEKPLEVTFKKKVYIVDDPGIANMLKIVKCFDDIQKGGGDVKEFAAAIYGVAPNIPKEIFATFSIKQLVSLYNELGKHFMSSGEAEAKDPLSEK